MFKKVSVAIEWLESQKRFRPKDDLSIISNAYKTSKINLEHVKKIHVAGTNGKGSVASFITNILDQSFQVGTFTSPYLIKFNERIMINNIPISNAELLKLINWGYQLNEEISQNDKMSFFELLTIMSLKHFSNKKVDYIVMEVGIGGLLDATNVLNYDVSIITSIALDHPKQLGTTKSEVLKNKLGIIKENNRLIMNVPSDLRKQVQHHLMLTSSSLDDAFQFELKELTLEGASFKYQKESYEIKLPGIYQITNAICAIKAVQYLEPQFSISKIKSGLLKTDWAGRLDLVQKNPKIYLDGGHNPAAIEAVMNFIKSYQNGEIHVLFSALADKEINEMLTTIKQVTSKVTITTFPDARNIKLGEILVANEGVRAILDMKQAINQIQKEMKSTDLLLITGSIHFIGYVKRNYKFKKK